MTAVSDRPLRADAARNAERILRAARETYGELGPDAPIEAIARRAEVGERTLYRRFPTKGELIRAALDQSIEEDLMPAINEASDATNMTWKLVDTDTRKENGAIDWTFRVGDRVKIRLENGMEQDHPMHHPFHIHGAGRFLVLSRNDVPEDNLVWKDTVLVRPAETVDILLDVSNPGRWMAHCHIAEHNQSGMMFSFNVARGRATAT